MFANRNSADLSSVPRSAYSPRSPPVPHIEDPVDDASYEQQQAEAAGDEDDIPYPEPTSEQTLLPPPNFRPFFTLIEDITSGEHYHPYVHYVFADDDPVVITAASMRSLGLDETKYLSQPSPEEGTGSHIQDGQEEYEEAPPAESPLPPPIPGVNEHYLIIDVGPDGRSIVDAQSLSPAWQISDTSLRTAPSFDETSPDQGFMLRIQGIGISNRSKGKGKGLTGQDKTSDALGQSPGDILGTLDRMLYGIQESLEVAARISEPPRLNVPPGVDDAA